MQVSNISNLQNISIYDKSKKIYDAYHIDHLQNLLTVEKSIYINHASLTILNIFSTQNAADKVHILTPKISLIIQHSAQKKIEQKGMPFDHDFGYSFLLLSSLLKKEEREKKNEVAKIVIKSHTFLLYLRKIYLN